MIRVIRELVYTYPDAEAYLADKARWTSTFTRHHDGMSMHSLVIQVRVFSDPPQPD